MLIQYLGHNTSNHTHDSPGARQRGGKEEEGESGQGGELRQDEVGREKGREGERIE